jgi:methionyl-tRNA formyltransferase
MSLRVVFAGTPEFAATILQHLLRADIKPVRVLTQPDRPQGRGRKLTAPPVKRMALEAGIEVLQPATLSHRKPEGQAALSSVLAEPFEVLIVAAYGLMIPRPLLVHPTHGAINVHASLLPRWRGAAPVEYAIMANDAETGITLMQMDAGLDTGPMLARAVCPISATITGSGLTAELAELGGQLLIGALPNLGRMFSQPQDEAQVTHAPKLRATDAIIDWSRSATEINNQVRALTDRQTAETTLRVDAGTVRLRVLESEILTTSQSMPAGTILENASKDCIPVACGHGVLGLRRLQLSIGKGTPLSATEARNGFAKLFAPGRQLGETAP